MNRPEKKTHSSPDTANGGPGRLASESEHDDGTVDPNDSGGQPVPTADEPRRDQPRLDPQKVPPPNVGGRS